MLWILSIGETRYAGTERQLLEKCKKMYFMARVGSTEKVGNSLRITVSNGATEKTFVAYKKGSDSYYIPKLEAKTEYRLIGARDRGYAYEKVGTF